MRPSLAFLCAWAVALAAAPAAFGQAIFIEIDGGGIREVSAVQTSMRVTGSVSVDFHGDASAGCAAAHLCDVSGNVTWDPSGRGSIYAYGYRSGGQRFEGSFLSFGDGEGEDAGARTSARVHRSGGGGLPGGLCADALAPSFAASTLGDRPGTSTELGLIGAPAEFLGSDTFRTRCAGPATDDLRALLPTHVVSERFIRQGRGRLDFSAERSFSAGGLTGTLHSDVVLHIGRSKDQLHDQTDPGPTHKRRRRAIDVSYRLESVSGQVVTSLHGLADPDLCGPLDACGLMGTVTTAPRASSGTAHMSAESSYRHSPADLRRAVGLERGGRPKGVQAFGYARWGRDTGTITTSLTRGGAPACSDSAPLGGPGALYLAVRGSRVVALYGGSETNPTDPLRTRCPGPSVDDAAGSSALARASVPLTAFARRRVTLRLTAGHRFRSDGYAGGTSPDITIVLRRTKVKQYVQSYDVPDDFPKPNVFPKPRLR